MVVVVLTAVPVGLRGFLTRWLMEISAGVFVGHLSARLRDTVWDRVVEDVGRGRAIMVESSRNEQRLTFRVHNHTWQPTDLEGLHLMLRPDTVDSSRPGAGTSTVKRSGWSYAGSKRFRNRT